MFGLRLHFVCKRWHLDRGLLDRRRERFFHLQAGRWSGDRGIAPLHGPRRFVVDDLRQINDGKGVALAHFSIESEAELKEAAQPKAGSQQVAEVFLAIHPMLMREAETLEKVVILSSKPRTISGRNQ